MKSNTKYVIIFTGEEMIENLNEYIDSTLLKPNAKLSDIEKLCNDAREYKFCSVCINPAYVSYAKKLLAGTQVKVCTVIGFPLGQNETTTKMYEARIAVDAGADELDIVINVAKLLDCDYEYVEKELGAIRALFDDKIVLKAIIETCYLNKEEIIKAVEICEKAGVDFIKTSTGYGTRGASIEDIETIKSAIKGTTQIKASGGIKSRAFAEDLIKAGAMRIGTSSAVSIMKEGE